MGGLVGQLVESELGQALKGVAKRGLMSGFAAIERESPTAKLFSRAIQDVGDLHGTTAGPVVDEIRKNLGSLSKDELSQVFTQMDTGKQATSSRAFSAAVTESLRGENEYGEYIKRGMSKPQWRVQNWFPHTWDPSIFEGKNKQAAIDHLVSTGQAKDPIQAEQLLEMISPGGRRVYGLERPRRVNLPGYKTDPLQVLTDFHNRAIRRRVEADHFGPNDENLTAMLSRVKQEGGDAGFVQHVGEHVLRRRIGVQGPVPGLARGGVENAISSLEVASKLSLAPLSHIGQPLTIPLITGMSPFVRGAARAMFRYGDSESWGIQAGAILRQALRESRAEEQLEVGNLGNKVLKPTGFNFVDKFKRLVAANAGKFSAEEHFASLKKNPGDTGALRHLTLLGVDTKASLERGALSDQDLRMAAKRVSDITQFNLSAGTVPVWWRDSPEHRIVTMFKPFFFQQAKFVKDFALMPAVRHGNFKPLILMSILFPTFGEISADLKHYARYGTLKDRPSMEKYPLDRMLDNAASVGALGIWQDTIQAMSYNDRSAFWRYIGGPVLSDAVDMSYLGYHAFTKPHPIDKLTDEGYRKLLRSVPVAGPYLYHSKYHSKYRTPFQRGVVTKAVNRAAVQ